MGVPSDPEADLHSEFSWDAAQGSMDGSRRRALDRGLGVVAFTDHADRVEAGGAELQISGHLECAALCQQRFPRLTILSGVELEEPPRFPDRAQGVLAEDDFDVVPGAVHCVEVGAGLVECRRAAAEGLVSPPELIRGHLAELMHLLRSPVELGVLAHLEYPKRYWRSATSHIRAPRGDPGRVGGGRPEGGRPGVKHHRGWAPERGLRPAPEVIHWWRGAGGRAVSTGSDAHGPNEVGRGLNLARQALEAAGFTSSAGTGLLWATSPGLTPSRPEAAPGILGAEPATPAARPEPV